MKRTVSFMVALAVVAFCTTSFADTATKFKGGIRDILMSPMQVSDSVKVETKDAKFLPFALVGGVLKGTFYMAKQIVTGTVDAVTSPLDMIHR